MGECNVEVLATRQTGNINNNNSNNSTNNNINQMPTKSTRNTRNTMYLILRLCPVLLFLFVLFHLLYLVCALIQRARQLTLSSVFSLQLGVFRFRLFRSIALCLYTNDMWKKCICFISPSLSAPLLSPHCLYRSSCLIHSHCLLTTGSLHSLDYEYLFRAQIYAHIHSEREREHTDPTACSKRPVYSVSYGKNSNNNNNNIQHNTTCVLYHFVLPFLIHISAQALFVIRSDDWRIVSIDCSHGNDEEWKPNGPCNSTSDQKPIDIYIFLKYIWLHHLR